MASELCTIVDDGTLPNRRGSLAIDDEGTPGQYNVLVENGILRGYMQDKLNARLMGVAPTGKQYTYGGISIDRVKDGQIVESWVNWDKFDLFQELGLVTQPKASAS